MPVSKARLGRLKRDLQFHEWIAIRRYLECLTLEQLDFFAQHGYVEGTVTKPEHSELDGLSKKALQAMWREDERLIIRFRGSSGDARLFYEENGHFPDEEPAKRR